jgi:hypothetical protein
MDQENDKNPIAEIFDEMFTLLEAMETRSVAMLNYLQGQQGVTDENLAPYMDRASAASEVRWRAARARMEHLLAPKPKSSTDAAKDTKGKDEKPKSASPAPAQAKEQSKPESKDLGKELAAAPSAADKSHDEKDTKTQNAKPATEDKTPQNQSQQRDPQKGKDAEAKPTDAESQASALAGDNKSKSDDTQKSDAAKTQSPKSDAAKTQSPKSDAGESTKPQSSKEEKQTQKAAK